MKFPSLAFLLFLLLCSCGDVSQMEHSKKREGAIGIIPQPKSIAFGEDTFVLGNNPSISSDNESLFAPSISYLKTEISVLSEANNRGEIIFKELATLPKEGYQLTVSAEAINIAASSKEGAFYGIQSLLQLVPLEVAGKTALIPSLHIKDEPKYPYRGMHLDVCRHFFSVAEVKEYLDLMAMHKFNTFHWHLTEDQGWRIEIKKYPKLTEIGGYRNGTLIGHYNEEPQQFDGKKYGGFYTQEEIKEVIAYASERCITVIPEIELPGHSQAALAAYPELACTEGPFEVLQKWGISDNVYCPTEYTFEFLENVLAEVIDLFPGEYLHIGGDECPKIKWEESSFCQKLMIEKGLKNTHELQSYFIQRIEKFVNSKGKKIIGWDEILEGGLAPNAAVMSWRGTEGGIAAAKEKHPVVMTPTSHCYFDYYQSDHPDEPLAIGGFLPLKKVYDFDPMPKELIAEYQSYILGAQGNLWTEYIPTKDQLFYMTYPRATALSEVVWGTKTEYSDFVKRLVPLLERLEKMGAKTANHLLEVKGKVYGESGRLWLDLSCELEGAKLNFHKEGEVAYGSSFSEKVEINNSGEILAKASYEGRESMRPFSVKIDKHLAAGKSIKLKELPSNKYEGNGPGSLINGVQGSDARYGDAEWLGYYGVDFEAIVDLGAETEISEVSQRYYVGEGQWIFHPKKVALYGSMDGENFELLGESKEQTSASGPTTIKFEKLGVKARYIKLSVDKYGLIEDGKQGAGNEAWLFVDEIIVR